MKTLSPAERLQVNGGCCGQAYPSPMASGEERESVSTFFRRGISWMVSSMTSAWHFVEEKVFPGESEIERGE